MGFTLQHSQRPSRTPLRSKPVQRGASRPVVKEPLRTRLPKMNFSGFKRLTWPLILVALVVGGYVLLQAVLPYIDRPIARIGVKGKLNYVSPEDVQRRIEPFAEASFFKVDLPGMRRVLEEMPWITRAEVRRVWPDQLEISLEEQLPIARWGKEALVNNQGVMLSAQSDADYRQLPMLFGPENSQQKVMQQYQLVSQMLRPLGLSVTGLEQRDRGSWFVTVLDGRNDNTMELLLGRDHLVEKMRRLLTIYNVALKEQSSNIARIDLRYGNGLAVAWREQLPAETTQGMN